MFAITLFEEKQVRRAWNAAEEKWYFSVDDVVGILTGSVNVKDYIKKLRRRDPELDGYWGTNCPLVEMTAADGKKRKIRAAHAEAMLRIIQSIPSPKAEPFKRWLAKVGYERLEEIENPATNPHGIVSPSPRLPRGTRGYLGTRVPTIHSTPSGLCRALRGIVPSTPDATPMGLDCETRPVSQGSGVAAATLGFETESRWDSPSQSPTPQTPPAMKTIFALAALALTLGHATANYADSPNVRVDTRARNLVSLSVLPATQPAPAPSPDGPQPAPAPTSSVTLPSGGTMQFEAWALYDDGSSEDVTTQAKWSVGRGLPRSTSFDQGLLKLGVTGYQLTGTVRASFAAGIRSAISSCGFTVLPGPQIEVSAVVAVVNYRYQISATAHVVGNQQPVNENDFQWDLDGDEIYGESGETTSLVTKEVSLKGNYLLRVKIWAEGKFVARSFIVEVNQAPVIGQPVTLPVQDITVDGLKVWNGSSLVPGGLAAGRSGLAVVIHGLEDSTASPWVGGLCDEIQGRVANANVAAWDWRLMADPTLYLRSTTVRNDLNSLLKGVSEFIGDMLVDLLVIRKNGEANGVLLAERLFAEQAAGRITKSTPIHLIGHSAGGFVAGECAKRLKWMGFSNLQVTMLDTPVPFRSHVNSGWRTERYISGFFGGRFETEPGTSKKLSDLYNGAAWIMGDRIETIDCTTNSYEPYMGYSQSTAAVLMTSFEARGLSGVTEGANYRRVEIQHSGLPSGVTSRHSYAYQWYQMTVNGTVSNDGFAYSNLLGSTPFPAPAAASEGDVAQMPAPAEIPPPPVDLDGFTYFGTAAGSGGVHTFTENTDAGMWKDFTLPIGSQTLRFRYQFTTPGDGDFLAAYWGEEAVLVICPDTDSARAGFVDMEADVSRFGGQQGNLVFKLVSRGEVNAVAQIDQVQIVLSDDPDDDGLTNAQEASYGSNAHSADTDGDGLSDSDEVSTHGTHPAMADTDCDMVPDAAELAASTNPLDKNSFLRPRMERGAGGQPELLWQGVNGRTYSVVRSLDLSGTAFDFIRTEVPGAGVDCTVTDPDTAVNPRAFYWVLPE